MTARDAGAWEAISKLRAMRRQPVPEEALYDGQGQPVRLRFVVATSVLVAIVNAEPEAERFHEWRLATIP